MDHLIQQLFPGCPLRAHGRCLKHYLTTRHGPPQTYRDGCWTRDGRVQEPLLGQHHPTVGFAEALGQGRCRLEKEGLGGTSVAQGNSHPPLLGLEQGPAPVHKGLSRERCPHRLQSSAVAIMTRSGGASQPTRGRGQCPLPYHRSGVRHSRPLQVHLSPCG